MTALARLLTATALASLLVLAAGCGARDATLPPESPMTDAPPPPDTPVLRVATFNTSLYDDGGALVARLDAGDANAAKIAATLQHLRPDVVLLNEFDFDADGRAADLFQRQYLERGQHGQAPLHYAFRFFAPVNTGVPSGLDLDGDGRSDGPGDAWGFGRHPGQYGMLVLSRFPIDVAAARTFQQLRWSAMPDARRPHDPATGAPWYPDAVWSQLRLSSKSHWDLPIDTPLGRIHLLAAHPTPPVFDGPEDRNGARNHDEIRLWTDYLDGAGWIVDDLGARGGLPADARFVVVGDLNADPVDGDGHREAIARLLAHPRMLAHAAPRSAGAAAAAQAAGGANLQQRGDPAEDTGDFGPRVGNLRLDYALPSTGFTLRASGVFWPQSGDTGADWLDATDHRLVWLDLANPDGAR